MCRHRRRLEQLQHLQQQQQYCILSALFASHHLGSDSAATIPAEAAAAAVANAVPADPCRKCVRKGRQCHRCRKVNNNTMYGNCGRGDGAAAVFPSCYNNEKSSENAVVALNSSCRKCVRKGRQCCRCRKVARKAAASGPLPPALATTDITTGVVQLQSQPPSYQDVVTSENHSIGRGLSSVKSKEFIEKSSETAPAYSPEPTEAHPAFRG